MSGSVLTYDPKSVTIIVCGYIIPGLVSISLNWKSSVFSVRKGIRGVHTRVYTPDRQATLILEVLPTSTTNDVFSQIVLQDSANHAGLLSVMLKDTSGTSRFSTNNAYMATFPDLAFNANGITTRKWQVEILSFDEDPVMVGGNASHGIDVSDILSSALSGAQGLLSDAEGLVSSGLDSVAGFF